MSISKRNPRGNFNWQNRLIKKTAINCGQLPIVECTDDIKPVAAIGPDKFCITDPPQNEYIIVSNGAIPAQFYDNTFKLYKDGVLLAEDTLSSGSLYYALTPATLADGGVYTATVTNSAGCSNTGSVQINTYLKPYFTISSVASTIPCTPPDPGNGEITLTVDNPVPGYTYAFSLCYDIGAGAICEHYSGTFTSYTFTGLCNIRYIGFAGIILPGGNPAYGECIVVKEINLGT